MSEAISDFIERFVTICEANAWQAGVGGVETAGHVLSYLSAHPEWLGAFMTGGLLALPDDFMQHGRLTYHAVNGKVVHPKDARLARAAKKIARDALANAAGAHASEGEER